MNKRILKKYLNREWKKAKKSLQSFVKKDDPKALHRFRVQVKKLRAFITLDVKTGASGKLKKYFKPLSKIFAKAGTIRDAQLSISLGKQQKADKDFLAKQKQQERINTRNFRRHGESYLHRAAKSHQQITRHLKPFPDKKIRAYYEERLQWIAQNIGKGKDMLHPCRKEIKVLLYDYKFTRAMLPQQLNKHYLKALVKAIGKWHDNTLASKLFPALREKEQDLLMRVHELSTDFNRRAIHIPPLNPGN